jgi:hypothetical protein
METGLQQNQRVQYNRYRYLRDVKGWGIDTAVEACILPVKGMPDKKIQRMVDKGKLNGRKVGQVPE